MSFDITVQQWVHLDNQIKTLSDKLKELREKKNELGEIILQTDKPSVKITDGTLKIVSVKETQPLTFKHLETCLSEIIANEEQVQKIIEYVKNKREVKQVQDIKRVYDK